MAQYRKRHNSNIYSCKCSSVRACMCRLHGLVVVVAGLGMTVFVIVHQAGPHSQWIQSVYLAAEWSNRRSKVEVGHIYTHTYSMDTYDTVCPSYCGWRWPMRFGLPSPVTRPAREEPTALACLESRRRLRVDNLPVLSATRRHGKPETSSTCQRAPLEGRASENHQQPAQVSQVGRVGGF